MSKIEKQNKYRTKHEKARYIPEVERRRASPKHITMMRNLKRMVEDHAD
jgi:hypothetical protein